jgi:hypothetical protein
MEWLTYHQKAVVNFSCDIVKIPIKFYMGEGVAHQVHLSALAAWMMTQVHR